MRPIADMGEKVSRWQHRRRREAHMLGNHRAMMVAAALELDNQLLIGEPVRVDGLQRPVRLDRGRLGRLIPFAHLLAPKFSFENFFSALETRRDFGLSDRQHRPICETVDVSVFEPVDQHSVEARKILNAALQSVRMDLGPVARRWAREMDWIELPKPRAGRVKPKLCLVRGGGH